MADSIAYKVMTADDVVALDAGLFRGGPVDLADGYIHLSTGAQLTETVERHFRGQKDLTIVAVDLVALGDAVRWEPSRGGQLFPHLYGPLVSAVVRGKCLLVREANGSVQLPSVGSPGDCAR
jgi:uncharacterized protein (DUF952 family)